MGREKRGDPNYIFFDITILNGIIKRTNEGYCFKQKKKGQYCYVPLNPQPSDTEVIELHRYYAKLKKDVTYQKVRVRWG